MTANVGPYVAYDGTERAVAGALKEALHDDLGASDGDYRALARDAEAIAEAKARPKARPGDLVQFPEPWEFMDGSKHAALELVDGRRNIFRADGSRFKLPARWRETAYTVQA